MELSVPTEDICNLCMRIIIDANSDWDSTKHVS